MGFYVSRCWIEQAFNTHTHTHAEQVSPDDDERGLPMLLFVLSALQESRKTERDYSEDQKRGFGDGTGRRREEKARISRAETTACKTRDHKAGVGASP